MLELGKSLALDCTVTGYPIHQVVFRHNQNIIKSISGALTSTRPPEQAATNRSHLFIGNQWQAGSKQTQDSYFVLDGGLSGSDPLPVGGDSAQAAVESLELPVEEHDRSRQQSAAAGADNQSKLSHVIVIVLEPQHAGSYQCFAYNQFESVQSSAYIKVLDDPPKFRDTFKGEVLEQRQDVSLHCSAKASPLPEITWSIDEAPIPESSRIRFGDFVTKVSCQQEEQEASLVN